MKIKKRGKQLSKNWIYSNFRQSLNFLPKIKPHFLFSLILFLIIAILGSIFPIFFEEQITKLIEELIKLTSEMNTLELISFIIFNNMKSAFFAMILGIFLGIVPVGVIVVNAYVLGFVANKTVASENILVLWRLLPHGILEIPAVLLSTALGLKLGFFFLNYHGPNKTKTFFNLLKTSLKAFLLIIIPLLVIAGIIEGLLISVLG